MAPEMALRRRATPMGVTRGGSGGGLRRWRSEGRRRRLGRPEVALEMEGARGVGRPPEEATAGCVSGMVRREPEGSSGCVEEGSGPGRGVDRRQCRPSGRGRARGSGLRLVTEGGSKVAWAFGMRVAGGARRVLQGLHVCKPAGVHQGSGPRAASYLCTPHFEEWVSVRRGTGPRAAS